MRRIVLGSVLVTFLTLAVIWMAPYAFGTHNTSENLGDSVVVASGGAYCSLNPHSTDGWIFLQVYNGLPRLQKFRAGDYTGQIRAATQFSLNAPGWFDEAKVRITSSYSDNGGATWNQLGYVETSTTSQSSGSLYSPYFAEIYQRIFVFRLDLWGFDNGSTTCSSFAEFTVYNG